MTPVDTTTGVELDVDSRRATTILRVLVGATFVVILNETIMVNAIPHLMHEFGVTARSAQWLSTAFMLTLAVVIPATGWLLQRYTTRQVFTLAMGLFTTGTVLAMLSWSFPVLLGARIVQASGTAVMMPLLMTTLLTVVPMERRGKVMGNVTLVIAVAPALGPAVSGVLLQLGSWRFIFAVTVPIAAAMFVFGLRTLVNVGETAAGSLDLPSLVLTAFGFGGFVYGLSQLGADPDAGGLPAGPTIVVGLLVLAAFVWRQLLLQRRGAPLLDLRTLSNRTFAVSLALMCSAFMSLMGAMIVLPMYLQSVKGNTALATGLLLMPGGIVMGLLGPVVGSMFDRVGARALVVPGSFLLLAALAGMATVGVDTSPYQVMGLHVLMSIGLALIFTPIFTAGLSDLPPHLYSHGSAILGTLQQVAAAIGTAVIVTILSVRSTTLGEQGADQVTALAGGIRWGLAFAAVAGVVVVVLAFFTPRKGEVGLPAQPQDGVPAGLEQEPALATESAGH